MNVSLRRTRARVALGSLGAALATAGVAVAVAGNPLASGGVYHGCVGKSSGLLRVLAHGEPCGLNEIPIDWNRAGPPGPQGPKGEMGPPGAKGEFPTVYRRFERAVLEPLGTLRLRVPCHDEQDEAKFDSVVVGGGYFINVLQPDGTLNRTLLDVDVFANAPSTELRSDRDDPAWDIGIVNKTTLERHALGFVICFDRGSK